MESGASLCVLVKDPIIVTDVLLCACMHVGVIEMSLLFRT